MAQTLTLDTLGVAIAGTRTSEGILISRAVEKIGKSGPCVVLGNSAKADPATAALVNGTMAYSIGLTDTHSESITHPGPGVIPAALAVGHAAGSSGMDVLRAIVLGYDVVIRIGAAVNPSHRSRGFHPTATCNPFGAALSTAILLGCNEEQTLWALGLAGSMAGGLYEFRKQGAMVMALHGGWPAQSGVIAAYLAREGFTGPTTILEGQDGFFKGFADKVYPEKLIDRLGQRFTIQEVALRPYCACRYAHSGIDALSKIVARHGAVPPSKIKKLRVFTHYTAVSQEAEPTTLVSARLSTAFNMAMAVVHGARLAEVSTADLVDPLVRSICDRVEILEDPELTALFPKKWACRVQMELTTGECYEQREDIPKGEPENPLTQAEIEAKFHQMADPIVGVERAERIVHAVEHLAAAEDLSELMECLSTNRDVSTINL
jgi:2-methylcitrate dehydratase PrpD